MKGIRTGVYSWDEVRLTLARIQSIIEDLRLVVLATSEQMAASLAVSASYVLREDGHYVLREDGWRFRHEPQTAAMIGAESVAAAALLQEDGGIMLREDGRDVLREHVPGTARLAVGGLMEPGYERYEGKRYGS